MAYPISAPRDDGRCLINWIAELDRSDHALIGREDWNRRGELDEFLPRFLDWRFDWLDVPALILAADEVFEFPMVDRDPLPRWTFDRVTLLGDAAHPMFPIGSNGASQAILDAIELAAQLGRAATEGRPVTDALERYEIERRPRTAAIVMSNRQHGPERVLDLAEERAPDGSSRWPRCSRPESWRASPPPTSRPPASSCPTPRSTDYAWRDGQVAPAGAGVAGSMSGVSRAEAT